MKKVYALLFVVMAVISCGKKESKEESGDTDKPAEMKTDDVKYDQYLVAGETLYLQFCSMCHQPLGTGLAELYPPLKQSDYIKNNFDSLACLIKNGKQGEITVNGKTYNSVMPAQTTLTDLEIAEVITYVANSWGNSQGMVNVTEVTDMLSKCQPADE